MLELIKRPIFTEKTTSLLENNNQYVFDIDAKLIKTQLRALVEEIFQVQVISINIYRVPRKKFRRSGSIGFLPKFKRAIVTLAEGEKITFF
jgi:large subunit ribosomal protein L23